MKNECFNEQLIERLLKLLGRISPACFLHICVASRRPFEACCGMDLSSTVKGLVFAQGQLVPCIQSQDMTLF